MLYAMVILSLYAVERDLPYCVMTPHLGEFSRLIDLPIKWILSVITLRWLENLLRNTKLFLVLKGFPRCSITRWNGIC